MSANLSQRWCSRSAKIAVSDRMLALAAMQPWFLTVWRGAAMAGLFCIVFSALGQTQAVPPDWLDSPEAREFRQRVAQLAAMYGESSGLDPQGLRVTARGLHALPDGCMQVEVIVTLADAAPRIETLRACKHGR